MSRIVVYFLLILAPALALVLALLGFDTLEKNILGWVLLITGISYAAGVIIYYWFLKKPFWLPQKGGSVSLEERGDRSFWLILPGMLAIFFLPPLEYLYLPALLPRTIWMQIIGMALLVMGLALRIWARTAIQGQYSGHVQIAQKQELIRGGPYRCIRHPAYAGYFLMALGICLGYSSVLGLAAIPILMLPGFAFRMDVEDKLLLQSFGDEFRAYAGSTKRIIPGIW